MARLAAKDKRKMLARQERVQRELAWLELEIDGKIDEWNAAEKGLDELVEKRQQFLKRNAKFLTSVQLKERNNL
jgi:phage-related minor tail protein